MEEDQVPGGGGLVGFCLGVHSSPLSILQTMAEINNSLERMANSEMYANSVRTLD